MQAEDSATDLEQQQQLKSHKINDVVIPIDINQKTRRRKVHSDADILTSTDDHRTVVIEHHYHHYHQGSFGTRLADGAASRVSLGNTPGDQRSQANGDIIKTIGNNNDNGGGGGGPPAGMMMMSGSEIPGYLRDNAMPAGGGWGNPITMLSFQQNNVQTNFTWILGCVICIPVTFFCVVLWLIVAGVFTWADVWGDPI